MYSEPRNYELCLFVCKDLPSLVKAIPKEDIVQYSYERAKETRDKYFKEYGVDEVLESIIIPFVSVFSRSRENELILINSIHDVEFDLEDSHIRLAATIIYTAVSSESVKFGSTNTLITRYEDSPNIHVKIGKVIERDTKNLHKR